jgi:hypothetical protein
MKVDLIDTRELFSAFRCLDGQCVISFCDTLQSGQTLTLTRNPQRAFQPEDLWIPKIIGRHFDVVEFLVGNTHQLLQRDQRGILPVSKMSALCFAEDAQPSRYEWIKTIDPVMVGLNASLSIANRSEKEQFFIAFLVGREAGHYIF